MTRPKQHHFVPTWYLEQFAASDGFLFVYDKRTKKHRRQRPYNTMRRRYYYCQPWAPNGVDPDQLEKRFGQGLEPRAKLAIQKLLKWDGKLTEKE